MLALLLLTLLFIGCAHARTIRATPVMGWSGYNALMQNSGKCDRAGAGGYNETTFLETAAVLRSSGLAAKGYVYLNADDVSLLAAPSALALARKRARLLPLACTGAPPYSLRAVFLRGYPFYHRRQPIPFCSAGLPRTVVLVSWWRTPRAFPAAWPSSRSSCTRRG